MKAYKDTCLRDTSWTAGTETPTPRCAQLGQCHRPNSYKSRETPGEPWSIEDDPEKRSAKEGTHQLCWGWRGGGTQRDTRLLPRNVQCMSLARKQTRQTWRSCKRVCDSHPWGKPSRTHPAGSISALLWLPSLPPWRLLLLTFFWADIKCKSVRVSHKHLRFTHTTSHPKPQLQLPNSRTGWLTLPVWPYRLFNPWWLVGWPQ